MHRALSFAYTYTSGVRTPCQNVVHGTCIEHNHTHIDRHHKHILCDIILLTTDAQRTIARVRIHTLWRHVPCPRILLTPDAQRKIAHIRTHTLQRHVPCAGILITTNAQRTIARIRTHTLQIHVPCARILHTKDAGLRAQLLQGTDLQASSTSPPQDRSVLLRCQDPRNGGSTCR